MFVDNVGNLFCNQKKPQNLRKNREEEESEWERSMGEQQNITGKYKI